MKNLLSVCILIYQSEEYIDKCIGSLICQTDRNFEIVLIDNASPDQSVERAASILEGNHFANWKVIKISENTGCGQGRTKGYQKASGTYIKYLDSDDFLPPYFVEEINKIIRDRSPDVITYGHDVVDIHGKKIRSIAPYQDTTFAKYSLAMFWRYTFKRELAVRAKIDTSGMYYADDRVFSIRLLPYVKSVEVVRKEMYHYRKNPSSATNCKDQKLYETGRIRVFEEYKPLYVAVDDHYEKKCLLYVITKYYISIMSMNCREDPRQYETYCQIYKDKYFQCLGVDKYRQLCIIPKNCLCIEALVIQTSYLLLKFKMNFLFKFIYRYLY